MFNFQETKKGLSLFSVILLYGVLSLSQSAFAMLTVITGGGQQVSAGSYSEDIVFKVLNEQGNPETGTTVSFSLTDPSGNTIADGLSPSSADIDGEGLVSTRLNGTGTIGNYAITAKLVTDETQNATANVVVVAAAATQLTLVTGNNQTLAIGQSSSNITFQLTDAFDNPVAGKVVNFSTQAPTGSNSSLSLTTATTDTKGQVTTRLETSSTDPKGNYTVIAILNTDNTVTTNAAVEVTDEIPDLPSLAFGMMLDATGVFTEAGASFNGGVKVNDKEFQQEVVLTTNDSVSIQGVINVDSAHVGQPADILVVSYYNPTTLLDVGGVYVMIDNNNAILNWDGNPANLVAFTRVAQLPTRHFVNMYGGPLPAGQVRAYFGYRLDNGTIVYNEHTINARIK
jgi:hypothetical protein